MKETLAIFGIGVLLGILLTIYFYPSYKKEHMQTIASLQQQLQLIEQNELARLPQIQDAEEKLKKANEIYGKIFNLFLLNLGIQLDSTAWKELGHQAPNNLATTSPAEIEKSNDNILFNDQKIKKLRADKLVREATLVGVGIDNAQEKLNKLEEALALDPNNEQALDNLGNLLLVNDELEKALPLLQKCLQLNPKNTSCSHNLYIYYSKNADTKNLDSITAACLEHNPEDLACLRNRGMFFLEIDRAHDALKLFLKMKELVPNTKSSYHSLGSIYYDIANTYRQMKNESAEQKYRQLSCNEGYEFACKSLEQ